MTFGLTRMMGRGLVAAALIVLAAGCGGAAAQASPSPSPTASPVAQSSPSGTPSPEPALWRVDGYIVNQSGKPLKDVCIVIGPNGCQQFSPHTDARGYWFIDVAVGRAAFDFSFELPGYKPAIRHIVPTGPIQYNVVLDNE